MLMLENQPLTTNKTTLYSKDLQRDFAKFQLLDSLEVGGMGI